MLLSSTHDFYLGRGPDAEWLGSVHSVIAPAPVCRD
jgi:hypothetical protein